MLCQVSGAVSIAADYSLLCLNCGMIVDAGMAPAMCPICKHPQGWFLRLDMAPFGS